MQTLLFVLGPFLLKAGIGAAAIYVALSFVARVLVPKHRLLREQRYLTEKYLRAAEARFNFTCDLDVSIERNLLLKEAIPNRIISDLHNLPPIPSKRKKITT